MNISSRHLPTTGSEKCAVFILQQKNIHHPTWDKVFWNTQWRDTTQSRHADRCIPHEEWQTTEGFWNISTTVFMEMSSASAAWAWNQHLLEFKLAEPLSVRDVDEKLFTTLMYMITYIFIHLYIHMLLLDFFIVFNKISFSHPEVQDATHRNTMIMYFYFNYANYSSCHKVWSYCPSLSDDSHKHTEEAGGCSGWSLKHKMKKITHKDQVPCVNKGPPQNKMHDVNIDTCLVNIRMWHWTWLRCVQTLKGTSVGRRTKQSYSS